MPKMNRFDWRKTIKPNIMMLKLVGLWPKGDESYGKNLYTVYAVTTVVMFQVFHVFFQTANLYFVRDDLKAITGLAYITMMCFSVLLKSYCLMKNMAMLKQLMVILKSDLFQPRNPRQRTLVIPNLKSWQTIVRSYWFFAVGYSIFTALFPILDKSAEKYRLPFSAWYPYNYKKSPEYEITYIYQILCINFTSLSNVNINTLIAAVNMYIAAQFDILCDDLQHLRSAEDTSSEVNRKLLGCVHHHREILKFAKYASQFYNWLLFVEFFVDGFCIGITMFQMTLTSPSTGEFHCLLSYVNAVSLQIFMYCWFGNEVELKSAKLAYAVFESDWTDLSLELKKNMIFFVLRVEKVLQISAFGLFNLSLENFVKIIRTAWSYFALLRQVSSRKS